MTDEHEKAAPEPRTISGASLTPRIEVAPSERAHWYHMGLSAKLPSRGQVDIAGLHFPKFTVQHAADPVTGEYQRLTRRGEICRLTPAQLELLAARLPRTVLRIQYRTGESLSGKIERKPIVSLIAVPTDEEVARLREECARTGRVFPRNKVYRPDPNDRPAAEFLYLRYLGGTHARPVSIDEPEPETIAKTGIRFPPEGAEPATTDAYPRDPAGAVAVRWKGDEPTPAGEDDRPTLGGSIAGAPAVPVVANGSLTTEIAAGEIEGRGAAGDALGAPSIADATPAAELPGTGAHKLAGGAVTPTGT